MRILTAILATILALAVSGVFGVVSVRRYLAAAHMTAMRITAPSNPGVAFTHNLIAWRQWPYSTIIRHQLFLSLMRWRGPGRRIRIHPVSVDRIYRISTSASPHTPALTILRVSYLISSGRAGDGRVVEKLLSDLRAESWLMPQTWVIEAEYAAYKKDWTRFDRAVRNIAEIAKNNRSEKFERVVERLVRLKEKLRSGK